MVLEKVSSKFRVSCGVSQGTSLGPLLFLLYINDLPNCLSNCEPRMYANDTHLTYTGDNADNIQLHLNQDLGHVPTYPEIFFSPNIFFCGCENFRVHTQRIRIVSAVHTYPIVSGNFLICSSAQFFCRRES